jgi:hypothetical protein
VTPGDGQDRAVRSRPGFRWPSSGPEFLETQRKAGRPEAAGSRTRGRATPREADRPSTLGRDLSELGTRCRPTQGSATCGGACRVHLFVQCPDMEFQAAPLCGVRPSVRREDRGLVEAPTFGATAPPLSREAAGQSAHRVFGPNRPRMHQDQACLHKGRLAPREAGSATRESAPHEDGGETDRLRGARERLPAWSRRSDHRARKRRWPEVVRLPRP